MPTRCNEDTHCWLLLMTPTFDAHVHLWERRWQNFVVGTWREGRWAQRDLLMALLDRHGVERACVLAACDQNNPGNNEFVASVCREHCDRFVMLSEIPLASSRRDELLERTIHEWRARGFRYFVPPAEMPDAWAAHDDFWGRVNDARLAVALNLAPRQAGVLPLLVKRYPKIRWLLDHMGRPRHDMSDAEYQPVLELAVYPNVFVKLSGFYAFTARSSEYPYDDLQRFVIKLRDAFSAQRLLWGSDAPPVLDSSSYEQSFTCLIRHGVELTRDDLTCILGQTARKLFCP
jgi:predicted TIM-barrel fold metal-dependent hydrolase